MRQGKVYNNNTLAGIIEETENGEFVFRYITNYFMDTKKPAISITLPKNSQKHFSRKLFSFFFNLLSEGENRKLQSKVLKIDENDHFGLLLKTANEETIGAIRVVELIDN